MMESFKRSSSSLIPLISLSILIGAPIITLAQVSPQEALDFLTSHNEARAQVGVGPVQWDPTVAEYAQNYSNQRAGDCAMIHSTGGPYGENLAGSTGDLSATNAVGLWVGEITDYDYNSNTCAPNKVCGDYTQVVWRDSVLIGCGKVRCSTGGTFICCNYDPPGNYIGERPY